MIAISASSLISHCSAARPVAASWRCDQVAARDLQLLLRRVARELDHFHAVAQRAGNRVEHVRRGDEHHAATGRTARPGSCRGRSSSARGRAPRAAPRPDRRGSRRRRACRSRPASSRSCASRPCVRFWMMLPGSEPDVRAPVAADLGLVVHAAQAHAHELASRRLGDALAERGLAHAGRADEAQDRAAARGIELAHREVLEDAPLDLLEAVVVLVEDAPRLGDVDRRLRLVAPTAARSASRDRCGSSSTRRRPRACARGASIPCARASRRPRGIFASVIAFSSSAISAAPSSSSPSSFWIVRICSRSRCLRLASPMRFARALVDLARDLEHLDAVREQLEQLVEARLAGRTSPAAPASPRRRCPSGRR